MFSLFVSFCNCLTISAKYRSQNIIFSFAVFFTRVQTCTKRFPTQTLFPILVRFDWLLNKLVPPKSKTCYCSASHSHTDTTYRYNTFRMNWIRWVVSVWCSMWYEIVIIYAFQVNNYKWYLVYVVNKAGNWNIKQNSSISEKRMMLPCYLLLRWS